MAVFRSNLTFLFMKVHGNCSSSIRHHIEVNVYPTSVINRYFSRQKLSNSLEYTSVDKVQISRDKTATPVLVTRNCRPMVVIMAWMLAKRKHLSKYAEVYLKRGIDVLTVHVTPWQLLWPVNGSQVVAKEVLQFLHLNHVCKPLYVHGFSVGGYIWAEVLMKMNQDLHTYQPIADRFIGQIWDSAVDVPQIHLGLPLAIFPHNPILRAALQKYVVYHMRAFYNSATCHYLAASHLFHHTILKCPALFLVSNSDPIANVESNINLRDKWISQNIKTNWKCWEDSKHVSHFLKYRADYTETLESFLDSVSAQEDLNILPEREKMQAKL